jgi:hypothetical protein
MSRGKVTKELLDKLVVLADKLDNLKLEKDAGFIDEVIKKIADKKIIIKEE